MTAKQGGSQKKRTHKISTGERRSSKPVRLSPIELALLGKGPTANYRPMSKQEQDIYIARKAA